MEHMDELVNTLYSKNAKEAYGALKVLLERSSQSDALYPYFDEFAAMSEDPDSYIRTRGLLLISANAKWDQDNKVDECIDRLLTHIMDEKPITSRQFIKTLPELAASKPELAEDIKNALRRADTEIYADSMQSLVYRDIQSALKKIK